MARKGNREEALLMIRQHLLLNSYGQCRVFDLDWSKLGVLGEILQ